MSVDFSRLALTLYRATNNMNLVHWPLMGGPLHLVQRGGDWAWPQSGQSLLSVPDITVRPSTASVPITILLYNGPLLCGFNVPVKGLTLYCYIAIIHHNSSVLVYPSIHNGDVPHLNTNYTNFCATLLDSRLSSVICRNRYPVITDRRLLFSSASRCGYVCLCVCPSFCSRLLQLFMYRSYDTEAKTLYLILLSRSTKIPVKLVNICRNSSKLKTGDVFFCATM